MTAAHNIDGSEAHWSAEQRLFARTVEVQPGVWNARKGRFVSRGAHLVGLAVCVLVGAAVVIVAVLITGAQP